MFIIQKIIILNNKVEYKIISARIFSWNYSADLLTLKKIIKTYIWPNLTFLNV